MPSAKRKEGPTNESFTRARRPTVDERPPKRVRQEELVGKAVKSQNDQRSGSSLLPRGQDITRAKDEDAAFPRGGASVLTPLEHKQIQVDATRDVLFEQKGETKKVQVENGKYNPAGQANASKHSKVKSRNNRLSVGSNAAPDHDDVKIEGLSYKVGLIQIHQRL